MKKHFQLVLLLAALVIASLPGYSQHRADAQTDSNTRFFSETGHTVQGKFLTYWEYHGALAQQGYPISDEMTEISNVDGKSHTVQYFERAEMELHPENQAPYDVLLSLLGRARYDEKYGSSTPDQKPNQSNGSVYFAQTGHRVGGSFLAYWRQFGGLAQQGYPISDEIQEKSDLDGKTYTVQYFERSVMEWHPGNTPPYDVLLSQLGTFRYRDKYGATPTPQPTPLPLSTALPTPKLIAQNVWGNVAATDRYIFWIANDDPIYSVHGYDFEQNRQMILTSRQGQKNYIATDGKRVVWLEGDVEGVAGINGYDLSTNNEIVIVPSKAESGLTEDRISLANDTMYYVRSSVSTYGYGIVARDLYTGKEELLVDYGHNPVVDGENLLYAKDVAHCIPGADHPPCLFDQQLYLRRSGKDTLLAQASGEETPFTEYNAYGDKAVWVAPTFIGIGGSPPYLYNISTGSAKALSAQAANNPLVNNNRVVWTSEPDAQTQAQSPGSTIWSLQTYDFATGAVSDLPVHSEQLIQTQALVGDKAVAYTVSNSADYGGYSGDLYIISLESVK